MGLTAYQILTVIQRSDRCYQTVRGYVAERHLEVHLEGLKRAGVLLHARRIDTDGRPDFEVQVPGGELRTLECKNVMSGTIFASGEMKVDFQRTRNQLEGKAGRFYRVEDFDILAACTHNVTKKWEFRFIRTVDLPRDSRGGPSALHKSVRVPRVARAPWQDNILYVLR